MRVGSQTCWNRSCAISAIQENRERSDSGFGEPAHHRGHLATDGRNPPVRHDTGATNQANLYRSRFEISIEESKLAWLARSRQPYPAVGDLCARLLLASPPWMSKRHDAKEQSGVLGRKIRSQRGSGQAGARCPRGGWIYRAGRLGMRNRERASPVRHSAATRRCH